MTMVAEEPRVLDALDEDEAYLFAILSDPSGLDTAEFLWYDPSSEDNVRINPDGSREQIAPAPSGCFRAWPYQWPWWRTRAANQIDQCARSVGKALDVETLIPTVDGWKRMGDLQPGDFVFNENGEPVEVLEAFDVMHGRQCFELEFDEGSTLVADRDHQWVTFTMREWRNRRRRQASSETSDWRSGPRKAPGPQVRTTLEIAESVRHESEFSGAAGYKAEANHRIEVAAALKLPELPLTHDVPRGNVRWQPESHVTRETCLEVHPYVFGYWLGDGDSNSGTLTIGREDRKEVEARLKEFGYSLVPYIGGTGFRFALRPDADRIEWEFLEATAPPEERLGKQVLPNGEVEAFRWDMACADADGQPLEEVIRKYGLRPQAAMACYRGASCRSAGGPIRRYRPGDTVGALLRDMGVCDGKSSNTRAGICFKRIPDKYARASEAQRLQLLQGIMDSDGHCHAASGRCEITLKSEVLIRDVRSLLASLGQRSFLEKRRATCNGVDAGVVYRLTFSPRGINPFLLKRKAARVRPLSVKGESRLSARRIVAVREVPSRPVRCISVDGDSHLFLAGETMIPTHNSLSIQVRGCAFPFLFPGQEMVITAPELVHLEPIVSLIETRVYATRTLREMVPRGKSAVTHRPFQMNFVNGARIIGRIPQRDGKGVKGIHPIWLELDEAQDYPHAGWVELRETLKRGFAGATWRAHGVTKGVRDDFYEFTQDTPDNPWKVHRFAAMWRPNWTDEERQEAILKYGSREDPDYRRNILGLHGDRTNPIFVLTQLMRNVDADPVSAYNSSEYFKAEVKVEQLELWGQDISDVLDFPAGHLTYAGRNPTERANNPKAIYWVGMDIGYTIDPSEILVFVEHRKKPHDPHTELRLLARVSMTRMPHAQQIQAILHTIDYYRPKAFAMDKAGNGLPLFQEVQEHLDAFRAQQWDKIPAWMRRYDLDFAVNVIKGYNFSERLVVDFDKTVELSPFDDADEIVAKSGMRRNAKEYATDLLREMVDRPQLWLPWDEELLKQFQGGTWTSNRSMDAYGRRIFSRGNDHCLDAARMMALGWAQYSIEEMLRKEAPAPVYDAFII